MSRKKDGRQFIYKIQRRADGLFKGKGMSMAFNKVGCFWKNLGNIRLALSFATIARGRTDLKHFAALEDMDVVEYELVEVRRIPVFDLYNRREDQFTRRRAGLIDEADDGGSPQRILHDQHGAGGAALG